MIRVGFGCDGARPTLGVNCGFFEAPDPVKLDEVDGWISLTLEENGWARVGDKHFCPQHNPELEGKKVTVRVGDYTEIAPGVRVRIPPETAMFELVIEVQRYEPSDAAAVPRKEKPPWLAKPPLIPGT
jgi:hypothetical protein